ncbi:MAG: antibiotic biosynthesis monooxygenase family protein [Pseudomonadota bacterium]
MSKSIAVIAVLALVLGLTPASAEDGDPQNVVLINTFTVPVEALDQTIAMWEMARDYLMTQPGYVSTRLHQSLSPDARYLLINVAQWESPESYESATQSMWQEADLPRIEGVVPGPELYTVIRE